MFNTNLGVPDWNSQIQSFVNELQEQAQTQMIAEFSNAFHIAGDLFESTANFLDSLQEHRLESCEPGCVMPPQMGDACAPPGTLQKGADGSITTPGGYKIESTGQYEWNITGPDGKSTKVWGDPHVQESDGGQWDFKRDSSFTLPDGTTINVNTKPSGDMTVTSGLEIINGNDRVQINDIDKGKGQTGEITQDGYLRRLTDTTKRDDFVMGKETDDWTLGRHEIVGSEKGGEVIKVGNPMETGLEQMENFGGPNAWADALADATLQSLSDFPFIQNPLSDMLNLGFGALGQPLDFNDPTAALGLISDAFHSIAGMYDTMGDLMDLSQQLSFARSTFLPM